MKTKNLSLALLSFVGIISLFFFGVFLVGCNKDTVEKINVIKGDCDFLYFQGDNFDETYSMASKSATNIPNIEVVYSNGDKKIVEYGNPNLTFTGYDREGNYDSATKKFNEQTITVEYTENGKTVSTTYNVSMTFNRGTKILSQPQNAVVSYPNGASFSVEVEDPEENEVTYQWQVLLKAGTVIPEGGGFGGASNEIFAPVEMREYVEHWYNMEGTEATKSTFNLKAIQPTATARPDASLKLRCQITNKYGQVNYTNVATVVLNNTDKFVPCVYIGDFAIKAGETLDLSTTNCGENSGKISLAENGYEITLDNVNFSNETRANSCMTSALALELLSFNNTFENYIFHIKGTNKIKNTLYQPEENSAGIAISCNFMSASVIPTVKFIGETSSKLIVEGGTELIYSNSDIVFDNCDVQLIGSNIDTGYETVNLIGNGIKCQNLLIQNSTFDCNLNGAFIILNDPYEDKDITIKNTTITGLSTISRVGAGDTIFNLIKARGDIAFEKVKMDFTVKADRFRLNPGTMQMVSTAAMINGTKINIKDNSDIKLKIEADDCYIVDYQTGEVYNYVNRVTGISSAETTITNSALSISSDAQAITDLQGISTCLFDVVNSTLKIDTKARGMVQGVRVYAIGQVEKSGKLTIIGSNVDIKTFAYDDYEGNYNVDPEPMPLYCTQLNVTLNSENIISVENSNQGAPAIEVKVGNVDDPVYYDETYVPSQKIALTNCKITTPASQKINQFCMAGGNAFIHYETIYDTSNTPKIASKIVIEYLQEE